MPHLRPLTSTTWIFPHLVRGAAPHAGSISAVAFLGPDFIRHTRRAGISLASSRAASTSSNPPNAPSSSTSPNRPRKSITLTTDTGAVPWTNLSAREKLTRGTQQSLNLALVALGISLTLGVIAVLWLEVFSPDSKTAIFNEIVDLIRSDARAVRLLVGGEESDGKHQSASGWGLFRRLGAEIRAHGGEAGVASKWDRNRTVASRVEVDKFGIEHMYMQFAVEGPLRSGLVKVHMLRGAAGTGAAGASAGADAGGGLLEGALGGAMKGSMKHWTMHSVSLDVQGQGRIWIHQSRESGSGSAEGKKLSDVFGKEGKLFGVRVW